jgi:hypothetical protein
VEREAWQPSVQTRNRNLRNAIARVVSLSGFLLCLVLFVAFLALPTFAQYCVCAVGGVLALLDYVARQRHARFLERVRRGLCVRCGYDLRATPHRCPECGDRGTMLEAARVAR